MTDEELAEMRRIEQAATPGPWNYHHSIHTHDDAYDFSITAHIDKEGRLIIAETYGRASETHFLPVENNAKFIALARTAVPALLDEIARLREIVEKLKTTNDGVPITPDMVVFPPCGHADPDFVPLKYGRVSCWTGKCKQVDYGENDYYETHPTKFSVEKCFSTHEAALAARDAKETK